jgi:ubiquinone/menaquinone biosynthesis C-methylase UbiE
MVAHRFVADYAITEGECLLVCLGDGPSVRDLQDGFLEATSLKITALYPDEQLAEEAERRIRASKLDERIRCRTGKVDALPFDEVSFDAVLGVGPILLWGDREKRMQEIHRVLRPGGTALVGGRFLHMPASRRVSSDSLRASAAKTGISSIRVYDEMGQWVEIRKGVAEPE